MRYWYTVCVLKQIYPEKMEKLAFSKFVKTCHCVHRPFPLSWKARIGKSGTIQVAFFKSGMRYWYTVCVLKQIYPEKMEKLACDTPIVTVQLWIMPSSALGHCPIVCISILLDMVDKLASGETSQSIWEFGRASERSFRLFITIHSKFKRNRFRE